MTAPGSTAAQWVADVEAATATLTEAAHAYLHAVQSAAGRDAIMGHRQAVKDAEADLHRVILARMAAHWTDEGAPA